MATTVASKAAKKGWSMLAGNVVGQLTTVSKLMYVGATDAPPPISSGLGLHSCAWKDYDPKQGGPVQLLEIVLAAPMDSTAAEDFDEVTLLNYAVGHTNPNMAQRFKQIGATIPRLSINGTCQPLTEEEYGPTFLKHFAKHPLVMKRNKMNHSDWAIRKLVPHELYFTELDGEKTKLEGTPFEDAAFHPKIANITNGFVAKLNSEPADIVTICNTVYEQQLVNAFVYLLDDEAFYVMGAEKTEEGLAWREYVMEYGKPITEENELAQFFRLTRQQAGLS